MDFEDIGLKDAVWIRLAPEKKNSGLRKEVSSLVTGGKFLYYLSRKILRHLVA
jgi:hypothetical protein